MYYFFQIDVVEYEPTERLSLRFTPERGNEAIQAQRHHTVYDCQYNYETGLLVASQGNGDSPLSLHLGIVPNTEEFEVRIRYASLVAIQNQLSMIRTRQAEAERARRSPAYGSWGQSLNRANRVSVNGLDAGAVRNISVEETPEPTPQGNYYSQIRGANQLTYTMEYEQNFADFENSVIPREVIDRATEQARQRMDADLARAAQQNSEFARLYGGMPVGSMPGSQPAPPTTRPPRTAPHRDYGATRANEVAAPRPTRRQTRSTRPKRRHYLTLVPYLNFTQCAKCFNDKDLKLMRVAALRCLHRLNDTRTTQEMPRQVRLWVGYEQALIRYGLAMATELRRRGFADTSYDVFRAKLIPGLCNRPAWIKWTRLRKSHQSYMMLREERRQVATALIKWGRTQMNRGRPMDLNETCQRVGLEQRRNWQHYSLSELRHSLNNYAGNGTIIPVFVSEYATKEGWDVPIEENFLYPENIA